MTTEKCNSFSHWVTHTHTESTLIRGITHLQKERERKRENALENWRGCRAAAALRAFKWLRRRKISSEKKESTPEHRNCLSLHSFCRNRQQQQQQDNNAILSHTQQGEKKKKQMSEQRQHLLPKGKVEQKWKSNHCRERGSESIGWLIMTTLF